MVSAVALVLRSMMSAAAALVLGLLRAMSGCCLVLVEADRVEVSPAIELLCVHPLSILGVAALVLLVMRPLPKAFAEAHLGSVLRLRAMESASSSGRRSVDADGLLGLGSLALKNLSFDPFGEG